MRTPGALRAAAATPVNDIHGGRGCVVGRDDENGEDGAVGISDGLPDGLSEQGVSELEPVLGVRASCGVDGVVGDAWYEVNQRCTPVTLGRSLAATPAPAARLMRLDTAGRWFGWSGTAWLASSGTPSGLLIERPRIAPRAATSRCLERSRSGHSMTASDQHQPASSRAIATLATVCRLRRSLNLTHRWCSRRLPSSPRARAAAGARSHRSRMVFPTR